MVGRHVWQGACVAGAMHGRGRVWQGAVHDKGHVWQGGMHGRWACMAGGMCGRRACMTGVCVAGEMATAVGGTHPTGIHSCY